jgi:hypothetical protein
VARAILTPRQRVNRLWRKVDQDYGVNAAPPPDVRFGKSAAKDSYASTVFPAGQAPFITVGRATTKELRSRDPYKRRDARRVVLWEMGRTVEGNRGTGWVAHKTNKVSHRLNRQQGGAKGPTSRALRAQLTHQTKTRDRLS